MNGTAVYSTDAPLSKVANAVLLFGEKEAVLPSSTACIHCGRCEEKCPVRINITEVEHAMKLKDEDERAEALIATGVRQCVDCACCSYVCPAHRPVLATNQQAKKFLKNYAAAQREKEGGNK